MAEHRVPKWLRVLIPVALLALWLAGAGLGGPYFGRVEEVSDLDLVAFLPESADATKVNEQSKRFNDTSALPAILAFEAKDNKDIKQATLTKLESLTQSVSDDVADLEGASAPPIQSDDKKAAFAVLQINEDADIGEVVANIKKEVDADLPEGISYKVTGPASFSADLNKAFSGIDGLLILVALVVVLVILLIVYRSPLLPVFVLITSMFALAVSMLVVWNLANAGVVQLNGQVQGILFILVIGAATDYSLLYVSRYREELYRHNSKLKATLASLKGSIEPIAASGGTVIAGLLCLLVSDLASNKALGPVGAVGIVFAILSALTLLPAILYAVGRVAFWPRIPRVSQSARSRHDMQLKKGIWTKVGRLVSSKPRLIWTSLTVLLVAISIGVFQLRADGVAQSELVLGYSEAREGQAILNRHFPDGSGSPALIIAPEATVDEIVDRFEKDSSVDSISASATNSESGMKPLGRAEDEIKADIREKIRSQMAAQRSSQPVMVQQQAGTSVPSVDELTEAVYPFKDAEAKVIDDNVLLQVTLKQSPDSEAARETVNRLRDTASKIDDSVLIGGQTAIALDTNTASIHDRQIIIPLVLAAITIILMLLLRSIVAPLLLLLTTVLSFGTALGVAALLFNHVWGFPGADPSVVLYAFVFLVALGIDYNIFLMTRVREESMKIGTNRGVIKGVVVTGGVITSAGVVLAATFAALAVIPILFLVQLAFIVAFGVLLDTIVIRSLLVPALIRDIGSVIWWPSKLRRKR